MVFEDKIDCQFDRFHKRWGWAFRPLLRDHLMFGDEVLNTNSGWLSARRRPGADVAGAPRTTKPT